MNFKFLILISIFTTYCFSQNSKISVELNHPIPFDNNFIADNYTGVIDIGVKYRFINSKVLNAGIAFNLGYLYFDNTKNFYQNYKVNNYVLQPKIFGELNIKKIKPFFGIGYTTMIFDYNGSNNGFELNKEIETQSGIDLNLGIKYLILKKAFVQLQYDYIILDVGNEIPRVKYNTDVNLLKIGVGYDF